MKEQKNPTNNKKHKRIELVDGWQYWYRQWSTWLVGIGLSIITFTPELVEALKHVWENTPRDLKTHFHPEFVKYFGYTLTGLSVPAKLIRQRKLHERTKERKRRRDEAIGQIDK